MLIIHGDHELNSRNFLNKKLENLGSNIKRYEAKDIDYTQFLQELGGQDLFGASTYVVVFGFFGLTNGRNKEKLTDLFKSQDWSNLILYENKSINANSLKVYKQAKIETFAPDKLIFQFLESLSPARQKEFLPIYQKLMEAGESAEMIFFMLIRQFRLLMMCNSANYKLPPWQKNRLTAQVRKFGTNLDLTYNKLYLIDKRLKGGDSPGMEVEIYSFLASL